MDLGNKFKKYFCERILEVKTSTVVIVGAFRIRDSNGKVNQAKFDAVWPRLRVLARAQPTDKYVLVKGIINSKSTKNR